MFKGEKTRVFWLGLITVVYSFFLICQGLWLIVYYQYIYPEIYFAPPGYVPNSSGIFQMIGAIGPSIFGGIVLLITGSYLMEKKEKSKMLGLSLISKLFHCSAFTNNLDAVHLSPLLHRTTMVHNH